VSAEAPYRKAGFFNNRVMNPLLTALGLAPALTVRGRTSGRRYTIPVLPLELEGKQYLVAPRGNTHWARNLRAVGEGELRAGGRKIHFTAREIPVAQRAPLVAAYVQKFGPQYGGFVAREFAALPDPADHPVFLIEPKAAAR
jgi:deazaflavin-dependent oxidoreductase (nitroreductase family)